MSGHGSSSTSCSTQLDHHQKKPNVLSSERIALRSLFHLPVGCALHRILVHRVTTCIANCIVVCVERQIWGSDEEIRRSGRAHCKYISVMWSGWLIEQGFTSAPTQYRLYGRRFFTDLMTQPTVSKHWRRVVSHPDRPQSNHAHLTVLQY